MGRVIHIELTAKDPGEAAEFYQKVFSWKFDKWEGPLDYWLVTTGEETEAGINGGLGLRKDEPPGSVNTINVADVHEAVALIEKNGGTIIAPVHAVPGVVWNAYFEDPEGNLWGLIQADETAR